MERATSRSHHPAPWAGVDGARARSGRGRAMVQLPTVGTPLPCPRTESPTPELIDQYHARYMACLEQLYDKYKDVYAKDRRHDMRFVH